MGTGSDAPVHYRGPPLVFRGVSGPRSLLSVLHVSRNPALTYIPRASARIRESLQLSAKKAVKCMQRCGV
ncbi:hypothetical protein NDU88_000960 [Pleurodeles waltl]|uniref:Uncharacterized protein n=1 Tax=Pleurodeles waltl TaxID=8319 RepID=A0AAV7MJ75_PLEWA|nr:hypothetical protein NDU88_000960 [Pleurodeles waltl]